MILDNDLKPDPELLQPKLSTELSMESSPEATHAADVFVLENVSSEKKRLPISEPKR
jgi:hypothetical protein